MNENYDIDIVSRISTELAHMTTVEQQIGQFILSNIPLVIDSPIATIAKRANVSQASITRFARLMGCRDVRDLKMRLVQTMAIGQRYIDDAADIEGAKGLYENIINILMANRKVLNERVIQQALRHIKNARQVIVIGMGGGSTICAQELQNRIFRLGIPVSAYSDGLLTRMVAASIDKDDVLIALSLGGYNHDIIKSAGLARDYGTKVIAITPFDTPLANSVDIVLGLKVQEHDYIYRPTTSRYAMLAMIDVLATELAISDYEGSRDRMRRIRLALSNHKEDTPQLPLGD